MSSHIIPTLRISVFLLALIHVQGWADELHFSSGETQTILLELYTSEGCSSCPPADAWLSRYTTSPQLWSHIIPLAFQVDYWNYLGWTDPLSKPEFSTRQRQYARKGYAGTVYTPGFFRNGHEWRGWFRGQPVAMENRATVGTLSVSMVGNVITAVYRPAQPRKDPLLLTSAGLGFQLEHKILSGENSGRTLKHDFVVLSLEISDATTPETATTGYHWQLTHQYENEKTHPIKALAFWVTTPQDPAPIQATGGWLTLP